MTIDRDLQGYSEELTRMIRHGINPTPRELTALATRLADAAEVLRDMVVFEPHAPAGFALRERVGRLVPALTVIEGGRV